MKFKLKKSLLLWLLPVVALGVVFAMLGGISAKYIAEEELPDNQAAAGDAYFTVDILGDTNELDQLEKTVELFGGGNQVFAFAVQNYFDDLRFTESNTQYSLKVTSSAGTYQAMSLTQNGAAVNLNVSNKTLAGGGKNQDSYVLTMETGYADETRVDVEISSSSPYNKTMKLHFILRTGSADVMYRVEDSTGQAYATLVIMSTVNIPAKNLIVDWAAINNGSNLLQVDTTDRHVHDTNMTLTTNSPGNGFLKQFTCTQEILKDGSIQIYFFKKDAQMNLSTNGDKPVTKNEAQKYVIYIGQQ